MASRREPPCHPLPGQHGRCPLGERARAAPRRRRRPARGRQPGAAAPRGGLVARAPRGAAPSALDPVRRPRAAAPEHRHLPLLLRAHPRAQVAPVPDPPRDRQEERLPLPRLRHPRQDPLRARLRQARRRRDRRLLRRPALGARGARHPAGARPRAVRPSRRGTTGVLASFTRPPTATRRARSS